MENSSQDTIATAICEECSDKKTETFEGGLMVLPTDTGNTVTYGLINSLKYKIDSEMRSNLQYLTELSQRVKRLEDTQSTKSEQVTSPNNKEQLVKLQELSTAHEKLIADLTERLHECEAKQHSVGDRTGDLSALKLKVDDLVDTMLPPIPQIDLDESLKQSTVQLRRERRLSNKRRPRPLSDYSEFSLPRSNSVSSTTSSGYKSVGIPHQDSAEQLPGLTSIREHGSNPDPNTAIPNPVATSSTPLTNDRHDSNDYLTDPNTFKNAVVDTLWTIGDLLDIISSINNSQQGTRKAI